MAVAGEREPRVADLVGQSVGGIPMEHIAQLVTVPGQSTVEEVGEDRRRRARQLGVGRPYGLYLGEIGEGLAEPFGIGRRSVAG